MVKLVDLISRILNHLDLHFYHLSMIYYTFSKFTDLNIGSSCNIYNLNPGIKIFIYEQVPSHRNSSRASLAGDVLARMGLGDGG